MKPETYIAISIILCICVVGMAITHHVNERTLEINNANELFSDNHPYEDQANELAQKMENQREADQASNDFKAWKESLNAQETESSNEEAQLNQWRQTDLNSTPSSTDSQQPIRTQEEDEKEVEQAQAMEDKQWEDDQRALALQRYLSQSNAILQISPLASNGEAWAQMSLGEHYWRGEGGKTNISMARFWLSKAAGQGDRDAAIDLQIIQN